MATPQWPLMRYPVGRRPQGTSGQKVVVHANAFQISRLPTETFVHYDVVIEPQVNELRRTQDIMNKLQTDLRPDLFRPRAVYDGRKNLYVSGRTPLAEGHASIRFDVPMSTRAPQATSGRGVFSVKLTRVAEINPTLLGQVITGEAGPQASLTAVNLLQVLVRQAPIVAQNTFNARSVFSSTVREEIGGGFELWRGYFQSVRPAIGKMIVNVDISTAAIYRNQPVIDWCLGFLTEIGQARGQRGRPDVKYLEDLQPTDQDWKLLKQALKNVLISVTVPADKRRARPIKDFVPRAGYYEFKRDDTTTTIMEHFQSRNNFRLRYPKIFGLCVNTKHDVVIPAEVCVIIPGQMYKKTLPPSLMPKVLAFSSKPPKQRLDEIKHGVSGSFLNYRGSDYVSQVGMAVDQSPLSIPARILQPPTIQYGGKDADMRQPGVWNVVSQQLFRPAPPSVWTVVSLVAPQQFDPTRIAQCVSQLQGCCQKLGMSVTYGGQVKVAAGAGGIERSLDEALRDRATLVIVILPNIAAPQRKAVKAWGDFTRKVATQCLRVDKLGRANDQYYNNVALKINVKLGGVNSAANSEIYKKLQAEPIMIVGVDVGHPGPGVRDRPSITSLVSSYDSSFGRYAAFTRVQAPRQEIIADLKEMLTLALDYFWAMNKGKHPNRIIFYRDGVSEGEFERVAQQELPAIKSAWDDFCRSHGAPGPVTLLLTFIVVGKRHHMRFFPSTPDSRFQDKSGNVTAGLVVDTEVANPTSLDFYIQSHGGLKGTSRPGHYIVLHDTNKLPINDLQAMSYHLCFVYARATRSVSIPAPVYYADLVCARAGFYFDDNLGFSDVASDSKAPFDIDPWKRGFHSPGPEQMFFM